MALPSYQDDGSALFDRRYSLVVTPPFSPVSRIYGNSSTEQQPLRCQFSVERDVTAHANKATIALTNLSLSSRQRIIKGTTFALSAGYRSNTGLVFYGKVDKVAIGRDGPDIVTSVECKDAADLLQYATIDRSYKQPVTLASVLRDIVKAMSVSIGGIESSVEAGIATKLPKKTFSRLHLTGTCADNIKRLLDGTDIEWSVQNGRIFFSPKNSPVTQIAVYLTKDTGLVNIPSTNGDVVVVESLINPRLYPGAYIVLKSVNKVLNGNYKVRKTKHTGDSYGGQWTVECECIPLDLYNQPLPVASNTTTALNYEDAED